MTVIAEGNCERALFKYVFNFLRTDPGVCAFIPGGIFIKPADITMCIPPLRCLPVLPDLLQKLCLLSSSLGPIGLAMWVCLAFGFFGILRQCNLAPHSSTQFDPSRHTCRGDIIRAPPGLLIVVRWTKTHLHPSYLSCRSLSTLMTP